MSKTLIDDILSGFDMNFDCLHFRDNLEKYAASLPGNLPEELDSIGASDLAHLGMAAIEQNRKNFIPGSTEKLRYSALLVFGECWRESAFWAGEAEAMNALAELHPEITPTLRQMHLSRSRRRWEFRQAIARETLKIFDDVEQRITRRGRGAGRPRIASPINKSPEQKRRDFIDDAILKLCADMLPPQHKRNRDLIRQKVPRVVARFLLSGRLHDVGPLGDAQQAIDTHCKRVYRRLENKNL